MALSCELRCPGRNRGAWPGNSGQWRQEGGQGGQSPAASAAAGLPLHDLRWQVFPKVETCVRIDSCLAAGLAFGLPQTESLVAVTREGLSFPSHLLRELQRASSWAPPEAAWEKRGHGGGSLGP